MTAVRAIAAAALVAAVVIVAVVVLGGSGGETYKITFQNAGQLVKGDDVQVGGRRIGSVKSIELTDHNQAAIKVEIDNDFAPLHRGTRAIIRATSLSGIANRYIALTPGANSAPALESGSELTAENTVAPVDLDQLFNTLDEPTRKSLQQVVQGSATQYSGKGPQANQAVKYFNPFISTTNRLIDELLIDQNAFTNFIVNSSKVVTAISERSNDLTNLVTNANTTNAAIASENQALATSLSLLPPTLRKANTTFVNLRNTLDDLDVLVAASKPATKDLAPFLRVLRPLIETSRPTIQNLQQLISSPGPNNDLLEATSKFPALERAAKPTFKNTVAALQKSQPVVEFIRPYTPDFVGWIRDFGQGAATYDANGHYARIQPIFNAFQLSSNPILGQVLNPVAPKNRLPGLQTNITERCPGTSSQVPVDKSAPFLDDGALAGQCRADELVPGP